MCAPIATTERDGMFLLLDQKVNAPVRAETPLAGARVSLPPTLPLAGRLDQQKAARRLLGPCTLRLLPAHDPFGPAQAADDPLHDIRRAHGQPARVPVPAAELARPVAGPTHEGTVLYHGPSDMVRGRRMVLSTDSADHTLVGPRRRHASPGRGSGAGPYRLPLRTTSSSWSGRREGVAAMRANSARWVLLCLAGAVIGNVRIAAQERAGPGGTLSLRVRLHRESGEPMLSWRYAGDEPATFDLHRSEQPGFDVGDGSLLIRGLDGGERDYFDMRTRAGAGCHYRLVALDESGSTVATSNEASVTSERRAFTVEGRMPIVLGWNWGSDLAFDLHVNLLLQRPWVKPMRRGRRMFRMTTYYAIDKAPGESREEKIRSVVHDPWHVGWSIHDEKWDAKAEHAKVDEVRIHDPWTPAVGNVMPMQINTPMAGATDLFCVEHYSDRANWPTIAVPVAKKAMAEFGKEFDLLPIRQLWMCINVFGNSAARLPAAFTKLSVYSALGYGVKGFYFFNDPGPAGFLDGPGVQGMPKHMEMIGILGAEMEAWGRHMLYSEFECEGATGTPSSSDPMSRSSWWTRHVHPRYSDFLNRRWATVQAAVQKHPRGRFLFVWPNMEIGYWAESVTVTVQRRLENGAKAWWLTPGMPELETRTAGDGFRVECGSIYGAAAYLITNDTAFAEEVRKDIASYAPEIRERSQRMARMDVRDVHRYLGICPPSVRKETFQVRETALHRDGMLDEPGSLIAGQTMAERLFRDMLAAGLRDDPPYAIEQSRVREASAVKEGEPDPGENVALASGGTRARATFFEFIFATVADQRNYPHLAIDGKPASPPKEKQKWGGENTAWVFTRTPVEPYPVLTIELPGNEVIGTVRLKQYAEPGIKRLAVEFVEDESVEFFELPVTDGMVELTFPARKARRVRLVPAEYRSGAGSHLGLCEVGIYPANRGPDTFERIPLTRQHHDVDLTRFGW